MRLHRSVKAAIVLALTRALVLAVAVCCRRPGRRSQAPSPASSRTRAAAPFPARPSASSTRTPGHRGSDQRRAPGSIAATTLVPGTYRVEVVAGRVRDGRAPDCARSRPDGGDRRDPGARRDSARRGRDRPTRRGGRAGGADSGVGGERRPGRRHRRLQREPPEGTDSHGPVLFDQSAQLGDQHPRPGRALRAHQ